jgi:hypothetical protein
MSASKAVEYAPLNELAAIFERDERAEVTLAKSAEGFVAVARSGGGAAIRTTTAPSLGLLLRALGLEGAEITIRDDGEPVGGSEKDSRVWSHIRRWEIGTVIEFRDVPKLAPDEKLVPALARGAKIMGEEANGESLPDHLLTRAAMGLCSIFAVGKSGHMSADLAVCFIASMFEQSGDGGSVERKAAIWAPIDTDVRFNLPEPWGRRFGRFSRGNELGCKRGGGEGERFLATHCFAVRVDEETYAAADRPHFTTVKATWQQIAGGDLGEAIALEKSEVVHLCPVSRAIRVGSVWLDEFYVDALLELGVTKVCVLADKGMVVATGVAAVKGLAPDNIAHARAHGPDPDTRVVPEVGKHYIIEHGYDDGALAFVTITYKSDQRMLARCEARRRSSGEWLIDGAEAEWRRDFGDWRKANAVEIASVEAALGRSLSASDPKAGGS